MNGNDLKQFIKESKGQKELSLVLAKDDQEFQDFQEALAVEGFLGSDDVLLSLTEPHAPKKLYLVINQESAKDLYDFAIQYPTGQVNLQEAKTMKNYNFNFNYKDYAFILLTTTEFHDYLSKNNLDFLDCVGMVYRSRG